MEEYKVEEATLVTQLYFILYTASILAAIPLFAATLFGLIIAILQAVTQIQDQSLPQTVKIAVIALILLFSGATITAPFFERSKLIFNEFPNWVP